jgi:hypothetical protein
MDAFASPTIREDRSRYNGFRAVETIVVTLAIGFSLFAPPNTPEAKLDASWQEMLIYAHAHGMQFGRDLIFTWGPWGFLCSQFHLGRVEAVPILFWQVAGQLLVALALATLTRSLVLWRRIAFVAAFLAFHWLFFDVVYLVLVALIGVSALMKREAALGRLVAWTLVLGFLAQFKFTYFVISSAAVLAAMGYWAARGSWKRVVAIAGGYAFAVVAAWVGAGQNLDNLYPYLRRSLEISSGYGDAMGLEESWPLFLWGSGLALLFFIFVWWAWRTVLDRPFALAASGFLTFLLFVVWKESFIRADVVPLGGHVFGLFSYILILGPVLPGLLFPGRRWHWFDSSFILCLVAIACVDPDYYARAPRVEWERIYGKAQSLSRLGALPQEWQRSFEEASESASLPAVRAAVGQGTVDVYNYNTGIALLNGLNLAARPVFQSYSAYTPSLEGWNLRFYQSGRGPDFLLWNDEGLDNRYPGQDDAMLVASIPGHYEPLFAEGGYWLFRKRTAVSRDRMERRLILNRTVRLSEEIMLPPQYDEAVWLQADAAPSNLGRLRSLLYKPALINIATTDDTGRHGLWRLVPRVAKDGFLLVPTLASGSDLDALMRGTVQSWVRSFHFEASAGEEEYWSHVEVGVFGMPGIPIVSGIPSGSFVALGIFDRRALSLRSAAQPEVFAVPEGYAVLLHAESEVVFGVPADAMRFSCGFGIRMGAYSGDGHTAGVEFSVDAVWASGRRERLWSRYLDPVARSEDRGTQQLDLELPRDPPERLILRTGAGPNNDNRWDWSYVSRVRFDGPGAQ